AVRRDSQEDVLHVTFPQPSSIVEFVLDDRWLGAPYLFPRQATLLKVMFLDVNAFTDYDRHVLGDWMRGFRLEHTVTGELQFVGSCGIVADVMDRIDWCLADGRTHFEEVVAVQGRRGSKGYMGAIANARVLWDVATGLPLPTRFGTPARKRLRGFVFA